MAQAWGNRAVIYLQGEGVEANGFYGVVWLMLARRAVEPCGDGNASLYGRQLDMLSSCMTSEMQQQAERAAADWASHYWP